MVQVEGRTRLADLAASGAGWSLLLRDAAGDPAGAARSFDVVVERRPEGLVVVVDGRVMPVLVGARGQVGRRGATSRPLAGEERITAPMPGRIVKVLVKAGDRVSPRQGLIVVEAMKMQNELRAARGGVVAEVRVTEGMPVDARALLIVLRPQTETR
jgi:biotin carboxyl carrier protein